MSKELGVIKKGETVFPFWGKRFNKITGLDPLGQQYPSEKIYSHLLPGITNLTNRIRYFGFYCWLLKEYIRLNPGKSLSKDSQRKFMRRSELLLAIVMTKIDSDVLQIPGSSKASDILEVSGDESIVDISEYADDPAAEKAYWKYSSGAFGQYYAASMEKIGLIVGSKQGIYTLTKEKDFVSGEKLALNFEKNIEPETKELFLEIIETGELPLSKVKVLHDSYDAAGIPFKSAEWESYYAMLMGSDFPQQSESDFNHRRDTIDIILNKAKNREPGVKTTNFLNELFEEFITRHEEKLTIKYGWFHYRLNEFWQYACGTFFWSFLKVLSTEKNGIYVRKELIEEMSDRILESEDFQDNTYLKTYLDEIDTNKLQGHLESIEENEKSNKPISAAQHALSILLMLFSFSKSRIKQDSEILAKNNLRTEGGFIQKFEELRSGSFFDKSLREFLIYFFNKEILFRHKVVAINKLGKGTRSTLKFSMEGDMILYEGNFSPSLTNPRIGTLLQILSDLQIIKEDDSGNYRLTEKFDKS